MDNTNTTSREELRGSEEEKKQYSEADVDRGTPERLKLGGSGENPQLIYFLESVHRPCHVSLKSQ